MLKLTAVATVLNVFFFGFGYANANVKQIAAPLQPPIVNTSATRATPTPTPAPTPALTLLGRALMASPFRRAGLRAKGAAAEHAEVLRAYRSLRARQLPITIVLVALGIITAIAAALVGLPQEVPYTSAFLFVLAAIAFSRFNWRCPVCGAHLNGLNPKSCTHCHVSFT